VKENKKVTFLRNFRFGDLGFGEMGFGEMGGHLTISTQFLFHLFARGRHCYAARATRVFTPRRSSSYCCCSCCCLDYGSADFDGLSRILPFKHTIGVDERQCPKFHLAIADFGTGTRLLPSSSSLSSKIKL